MRGSDTMEKEQKLSSLTAVQVGIINPFAVVVCLTPCSFQKPRFIPLMDFQCSSEEQPEAVRGTWGTAVAVRGQELGTGAQVGFVFVPPNLWTDLLVS